MYKNEYKLDEESAGIIVKNKDVLGAIIFRDILRSDANETIEKLRTLGVNTIAVLTGDNNIEAQRVMAEANIDVMHSELLPEQKLEKVKEALTPKEIGTFLGDLFDFSALAISA